MAACPGQSPGPPVQMVLHTASRGGVGVGSSLLPNRTGSPETGSLLSLLPSH